MARSSTRRTRNQWAEYEMALARFDGMTNRAKVKWVDQFAAQIDITSSRHALAAELPALARSVGVGWTWAAPRALRAAEVSRVHAAVRAGLTDLRESSRVRSGNVEGLKKLVRSGRSMGWSGGWKLPRHRTCLRLLPQPARGEKTMMVALFEAD